jgi:hypothetical protein
MDKKTFDGNKAGFFNLTGKEADQNLEAYISYLNLLITLDIRDRLDVIRDNQPKLDQFGKLLL